MKLNHCMLWAGLLALMVSAGCADTPQNQSGPVGSGTADAPSQDDMTDTEAPADEPATTDNAAEMKADESTTAAAETEPAENVFTFQPGPNSEAEVLEELIQAEAGDVFQFEEGVFEFTSGLSMTAEGVTIRGRGMDKTILNFKGQTAGAEGLYITSDNVLVEDLAIVDTKGNALKSLKANNIVLRRVKAEWTGGPKPTNGAYGLYPVSSKNVLVEECVAIGASDAGIYVGQSQDVIVRNCRAEYNVAGIEIENCHRAEVYGCEATNNTGGVLVFDLPDLPQQKGHDVRIYNNRIYANNTDNFAPKGNIVATVPTGTGVMVMANSNVEIFDNEIRDHGTINAMLVSYFASGVEIKDPNYYPYAEAIHVHGNTFGPCGNEPKGAGGELIAQLLGAEIPDIVWDGVANPEKSTDGVLNPEYSVSIHGNRKEGGEVTFANLGGLATLEDPTQGNVSRDLAAHTHELPSVAPVSIPGVE